MAIDPSEDRVFKGDAADTRRRLRHAGPHADAKETSMLVGLADALLGSGRARLYANLSRVRERIEDFSSDELDSWWGRILGVGRIAGVDDSPSGQSPSGQSPSAIEDERYATRLRMFMKAANAGISEESMRLAAEAGGGVPFRVEEAAGALVLTPLTPIAPGQRASVYEAVRRMAPASLRFIVDEAPQSYAPEEAVAFYSPSFYTGARPKRVGMAGPVTESENYLAGAESSNWAKSGPRSLQPTDGLPQNLVSRSASGAGCWHTAPIGGGAKVSLDFHTGGERITNYVKLEVSVGFWEVAVLDASGATLYRERLRVASGFKSISVNTSLATRSGGTLTFVNVSREPSELFVKNLYVGLRLTPENQVEYLALGGADSAGGVLTSELVSLPAEGLLTGGEWVSSAQASPNEEVEFRVTLSGSPVTVSALSIGTDLPGTVFRVDYSREDAEVEDAVEWVPLPGVYRLTNGRVSVEPCVARHLRLVFTNLSPLRLASYAEGDAS